MSSVQFVLGACVWVSGQQIGSLSCTGLGYWVVFDAFGIALGKVLPTYLAKPHMKDEVRRPYGNARIETLLIYAQSIFLIFAAVYVCKETFEHLLLSSGEGHHHHHGDEESDIFGIEFPPLLLLTTLISLIISAIGFDNHAKLASIAGNLIPPIHTFLPSQLRKRAVIHTYPSYLANLLANPYNLSPVFFCASILGIGTFLPPYQHRSMDLLLAGIETFVTFSLAYPAAVTLGSVLLQTSPPRGLPGGRMEAFLRAMREIERHENVLHCPPPHIWQLTPALKQTSGHGARHPRALGPTQRLVVTLELHVARDMTDEKVLKLTKWAWERVTNALRFGMGDGTSVGGECETEVTVGIVKG